MPKKRTQYAKPEMEFDNALMGYKPNLPSINQKSKKTKLEINWLAVLIMILIIIVLTFLMIKFD
jgi:hypothetical protein